MLSGQAELAPDPHPQFAALQGFDEIIIGAEGERLVAEPFLLIGGDHQDREFLGGIFTPDLTDDGIAIHVGHHQIQDQQIRLILVKMVQKFIPTGITGDFQWKLFQKIFDDFQVHRFIIDHQHFSFFWDG